MDNFEVGFFEVGFTLFFVGFVFGIVAFGGICYIMGLEQVIDPIKSYDINVTEIDLYSNNVVYLHLNDSTICIDKTGRIKKPGIYTVRLTKDSEGKKVESVRISQSSLEVLT